jgi:hypothetical protein
MNADEHGIIQIENGKRVAGSARVGSRLAAGDRYF